MSIASVSHLSSASLAPAEHKDAGALDLSATIETIQKLVSSGKKVALFIGRTPEETLPEEEAIIWISLDPQSKGASSKRLHLKMNFQNEEALKTLRNLFEKIVVDQSTLKYLDTGSQEKTIRDLSSLLNPKGEGTLIMEANFTGAGTRIEDNERLRFFAEQAQALHAINPSSAFCRYDLEAAQNISRQSFTQFISFYHQIETHIPAYSWTQRKEHLATKELLLKTFGSVTYQMDGVYPYENARFKDVPRSFFIAKGIR